MKNWYDKIAFVYDWFTERFYLKMRRQLIEQLHLKQGNRILIIACGTGQSFDLLLNKIGDNGEIVAIDYSAGMLKQAQKRIDKHKWQNIRLIHADARQINKAFFEKLGIKTDFDIVIGELAFSVIPDWKKVMKTSISLLKHTGKIGLLDWQRTKNDILTKIVNGIAQAETTRQTTVYAQSLLKKFNVNSYFFFKSIYIATGEK